MLCLLFYTDHLSEEALKKRLSVQSPVTVTVLKRDAWLCGCFGLVELKWRAALPAKGEVCHILTDII